ncbi:uncharacterized protein LY89DRAFT_476934 [Mollisia scopiformis]|uniref:Uncharacterized protein n=1 Tax=Mollisia scopiformis TaxID=149040 RepID=A0A194XH53_MOLSC|nr:uncharacterized protein LY89DRAFT_476934 [Mollisia scopiformis]KUJ19102.1 hypothetical protein LY89DRAFT_476934 [Mollisia scopiformis]
MNRRIARRKVDMPTWFSRTLIGAKTPPRLRWCGRFLEVPVALVVALPATASSSPVGACSSNNQTLRIRGRGLKLVKHKATLSITTAETCSWRCRKSKGERKMNLFKFSLARWQVQLAGRASSAALAEIVGEESQCSVRQL